MAGRHALAFGLHGNVVIRCLEGMAVDATGHGIFQRVAAFIRRRDWIVVYLDALAVQRRIAALAGGKPVNFTDSLTAALCAVPGLALGGGREIMSRHYRAPASRCAAPVSQCGLPIRPLSRAGLARNSSPPA